MKTPIAITMGDPAGIGPEIVLKALAGQREFYKDCAPVVIGAKSVLKEAADLLGLEVVINLFSFSDTDFDPEKINCIDIEGLNTPIQWGEVKADYGKAAFSYIEKACFLAKEGKVKGIVTAPIHKDALRFAKVPYIDHTQIFGVLCTAKELMTLFVTGDLRIFFYSKHIPLREVADALDVDTLVAQLILCDKYLKQLGISNPNIALAALNPHAGDSGLFGDEEEKFLVPAVAKAKAEGVNASGPVPADSVFHLSATGIYDGVLSLYHDQGHIAAKTLDFYGTVSFTMGLPFLRTSVDHGTAFEIAGKGIANEESLVKAIEACARHLF